MSNPVFEQVVFPAHAGVILNVYVERLEKESIPRTRGGDPYNNDVIEMANTYSPHTRG